MAAGVDIEGMVLKFSKRLAFSKAGRSGAEMLQKTNALREIAPKNFTTE